MNFYQKQGYKYICKYQGKKGIWYYYALQSDVGDTVPAILYRQDSYADVLASIKRRIEVFWILIMSAIMLFSSYMTFHYQKSEFYILDLVALIGFIYVVYMRYDINKRYELELAKISLKKE